jgi:hypothetical protein
VNLPLQRLVGAEQKLLSGLSTGVEGARDLCAAERAIGERTAVLAGERNTLGYALIDDLGADLGQPIDVAFPSTEVATFNRVVEQPVDALAIVRIVFCCVDAALRCNGVRTPRGILEAEALYLVSQFAERCCRRAAGQAGAYACACSQD